MIYSAIRKTGEVVCAILFLASTVYSQQSNAVSLRKQLDKETTDTNRVQLMWKLASDINISPDSALLLSQEALYLARNIEYTEGESRSLGVMANAFLKMGNYPLALDLNLQKLKLEEKRKNARNLASVLLNIGVVYALQEEYRKALDYYSKAREVIYEHKVEDLKYHTQLNTGDAYNRLDIADSAHMYFLKSLETARRLDDIDLTGTSMTGLGHSYLKLGNYEASLKNYREAIAHLRAANDDEILCEATLGLASLYEHMGVSDSAGYYASLSLSIAGKDGFLSHTLNAAQFLSTHYKKLNRIDSAFKYLDYVQLTNDSVNSKGMIRELQIISSNEQFRQRELEEERKKEKKERIQRLQLLFIGIFIPGLFLMTLLLNRVKVHVRLIRVLGVMSLLFFFEYLTLLLHPTVAEITNHTPVIEIIIFVIAGAILIPGHHRLEHWLIHKLIHHRAKREDEKLHPENIVIVPAEITEKPIVPDNIVSPGESTNE